MADRSAVLGVGAESAEGVRVGGCEEGTAAGAEGRDKEVEGCGCLLLRLIDEEGPALCV